MSGRDLNRSSNMPAAPMNLKVLLPFQIFADKTGVSRIVAETREGSFGLLPHRLDCVAALSARDSDLRDNIRRRSFRGRR